MSFVEMKLCTRYFDFCAPSSDGSGNRFKKSINSLSLGNWDYTLIILENFQQTSPSCQTIKSLKSVLFYGSLCKLPFLWMGRGVNCSHEHYPHMTRYFVVVFFHFQDCHSLQFQGLYDSLHECYLNVCTCAIGFGLPVWSWLCIRFFGTSSPLIVSREGICGKFRKFSAR